MSKPYQRDPGGERIDFRGIDIVHSPDNLPSGKYPYAQNVRRALKGRTPGRPLQNLLLNSIGPAIHSIRRLNDSTPAGPIAGYILVEGASNELFANATQVDSGLSGNPISLVPFRPNASVQPWMYVGDSVKMDKVRSDGTCYKMGIAEPQLPPQVSFVPASDTVSLVGEVTVTYWGDSPHSGPTGNYIWKNKSDTGGSGPVRSSTPPSGVTTGNSLLFDVINGNQQTPVAWTQYTEYLGSVNTVGTAVTWVSGNQFSGLAGGGKIVISGITYTIANAPAPTNTTLSLTGTAGTQVDVTYQAAAQSGTVPLFQPALESEGYSDFNFAVEATLYIPAAGTYTLSFSSKDETLWGIGNNGVGTATWAGPTGGQVLASSGQTRTALNGYPLIPKTNTNDGGGQGDTGSQQIAFSAPGNYPIEIDFDYWYHSGRHLTVKCNGVDIPPLPEALITNAQYRYTYRSSATGAVSNPSPESVQSPISVLSNNVTANYSTDPQVDKVDFYRLDSGLTNFTYVGTISNLTVLGVTTTAVLSTGAGSVQFTNASQVVLGQTLLIDSGANSEFVTVTGFIKIHIGSQFFIIGIQAVFAKTHAIGVPIVGGPGTVVFNDTQLDTDIADNPILQFDNFEPFPSIDLPRSGMVTVTNGVVTWQSGDQFNIRWLPGTVIIVGTVAYTLNTRPTSTTQLTASNVTSIAGVQTVVVPPDGVSIPYEIQEPILAAQPLPYLWGPTDNISFAFGCGDPLRPGVLYWCKGGNLDAAPDTNQEDVTSPSEPLQNGCIVNGLGMVFSSERAWLIYPNFFNALATVQGTVGSQWTLQESISTRGLYIPKALAVDGGGNVFFRGKDGVYISPGGTGAKSITDEDMYNLFPHEGREPSAVTIGPFTVYPPDDTQPQHQSMSVANGYLYYDYFDVTNTPRTLVYDIAAGGWVVDVYQFPVFVHALAEGANVNNVLMGCQDGAVRTFVDSGTETATSVLLMPSFNAGDTRAPKHWGDIYIEAE